LVATMSTIQHQAARKLLEVIQSAETEQQGPLNYKKAAKALGRDPEKNAKMVAQVCDLLDAAAALADVPLLALVKVRELSGEINHKAFADVENRQAIIDRSLNHNFSAADFARISEALRKLDGKGNRAAWQFVRETGGYLRLTAPAFEQHLDAINDIGTETPSRMTTTGVIYARDSKIREAVKRRAKGKCEFCGELGFFCADGTRYLECHHIIALANQGADLMKNVIALCPRDHREAHFGERSTELEAQMIQKIAILLVKK
jgi:HNH endonuclease